MASGLDWSEIQACLPAGLVISIDPGHVACQYGSNDCSLGTSSTAWGGNGFNSTSLSSSGCSSASSVSSNASSTSWSKTKHQVLYSANLRGGSSSQSSNEKEADAAPVEAKKNLDEAQTHLATEAALSVLTEPEDLQSAQNGEFSQAARGSNEAISAIGDSNDQQVKTGKNLNLPSTDATGDGSYFEQISNDSQAKSDIENQFPFNGFQYKGGRPIDGNGEHDIQGAFDFHGHGVHPPAHLQVAPTPPNFNPPAPNFIQKSTSTPSFTAATFAATKFGSTKLKSQAKRPHRLVSPCDAPASSYSNQLLDALAQPSTTSNQVSFDCLTILID